MIRGTGGHRYIVPIQSSLCVGVALTTHAALPFKSIQNGFVGCTVGSTIIGRMVLYISVTGTARDTVGRWHFIQETMATATGSRGGRHEGDD